MEERTIQALHPFLATGYDNASGLWTDSNGWQQDTGLLWHETTIDLSGYSMESLTFFPQAVGLQDPGIFTFKAGATSLFAGVHVLDIVTSVPMDINQVSADILTNVAPGMLGSDYEFETLLFGMYRFFTPNANIPFPDYCQLERSQRFDSGQPNAADKLYCYRIVRTTQSDLDDLSFLFIPAARQIIGGAIDEESELVYMQRLKRSYELANQV